MNLIRCESPFITPLKIVVLCFNEKYKDEHFESLQLISIKENLLFSVSFIHFYLSQEITIFNKKRSVYNCLRMETFI